MLVPLSFENTNTVVGLKQSRRAVKDGRAGAAYVALDADDGVRGPFVSLCQEENVQVNEVGSMRELGTAAGIHIGAAVVVTLK